MKNKEENEEEKLFFSFLFVTEIISLFYSFLNIIYLITFDSKSDNLRKKFATSNKQKKFFNYFFFFFVKTSTSGYLVRIFMLVQFFFVALKTFMPINIKGDFFLSFHSASRKFCFSILQKFVLSKALKLFYLSIDLIFFFCTSSR